MTRMIIRNSLLALLVGIAAPAFAQDNNGLSDDEILLNGDVVVNPGPVVEDDLIAPPPAIDGIPEEPQPRKRRQRQPAPDTTELPIPPEDAPIVEDGTGPDGEVLPKRRQRPPAPDTNELPIYQDEPPVVDGGGQPDGEVLPRRRHRPPVVEVEPGPDFSGPSAVEIERSLDVEPRIRLRPEQRVTIREFERRPDLRRAAPSIDIQAINFEFGSSEVPFSQYRKVENIAVAMDRLLRRDPDTQVLIEGHTDAVGSFGANQMLSQRRARSLKRVLVREFGIPADALETVGYGEEYLLVPTTRENWRNRRVTLRSIGDFVR